VVEVALGSHLLVTEVVVVGAAITTSALALLLLLLLLVDRLAIGLGLGSVSGVSWGGIGRPLTWVADGHRVSSPSLLVVVIWAIWVLWSEVSGDLVVVYVVSYLVSLLLLFLLSLVSRSVCIVRHCHW